MFSRKQKIPLPKTTPPLNQEIVAFQKKFLLLTLLVTASIAFFTYQKSQNYIIKNKPIKVLIANKTIKSPAEISPSDFRIQEIPQKFVPKNYIKNPDFLQKRTLIHDIQEREILLASHLEYAINPNSTSGKFTEFLAVAIHKDWLISPWPPLMKNDLIDIQVSSPSTEKITTIASSVTVITDPTEDQLVLNLSEEESHKLLLSRSLRLPMQITLKPQ